jgi:hypothetical protein
VLISEQSEGSAASEPAGDKDLDITAPRHDPSAPPCHSPRQAGTTARLRFTAHDGAHLIGQAA